ncbi:hypothetical protein DYB28_000396 [Aphanomyces astaci]|uniref:MIF4G domain-containing protein n=1 Tax=Aphanomyces astaci TaxID=112090 RepID=A0A9X8E5D7_APHAT|nr:hypothetical protein DYB28_000396 [Aphanomyces astaci]
MQDSLRETLWQQNHPDACAELQKAISTGKVKLKSDLKKSSALVKKLKVLGDANLSACLKDVGELNLTRYLSECVVSLVEAAGALKPSEVSSHIHLISSLHQRYGVADITDPLVQAYCAAAFAPPAAPPVDASSKQRQIKRRLVTLRILTELFFVGVLADVSVIHSIIHAVVTREDLNAKPSKKQASSSTQGSSSSKQPPLDIPLLVSFAKYAGADFFGGVSDAAGGSTIAVIPISVQAQFRALFDQAFDMIAAMYISQHQTVRKMEKRNMKEEVNRGELCDEHVADLAAATVLCEKLTGSITTLSEALQRPMPILPVDNSDDAHLAQLLLWDGGEGRAELHADGPFDDEDTRSFYEDLPDLLELVPAVVLGLTEAEVADLKLKKASSSSLAEAEAAAADVQEDEGVMVDDLPPTSGVDDADAADSEAPGPKASDEDPKLPNETKAAASYHHQMDAFFASLEDMISRDRCDKAAVDFCYRNTKATRTRLVNTLYSVPRTHLELLPYYSRLLATLDSVLKDDVGGALVELLVQEFNYFQKKKNQYRLESKVKNIRFVGELTKFKVAPPMVGFRCLRRCFADFQGHNVVIATTFLETCGRFLYCSKYTHVRTAQCLEIMMRLKAAKHLDPLADTLVQNAYYMCKPPEVVTRVKEPKDPVYLFMLHLLYTELAPDSVGKVVRLCRKFDWDDPQTTHWFIKAVLKVTTAQVLHMALVCDIVVGLSRYHEELGVYILDTVLESIHYHLTLNNYKYHQRHLGLVKLLGELYNHQLVTSVVVFDMLYWMLHHSHDMTTLDTPLPDDLLRLVRYDSWEQVDAVAHAIWGVELLQAEKRLLKNKSSHVLAIPEESDDHDNDNDDHSSSGDDDDDDDDDDEEAQDVLHDVATSSSDDDDDDDSGEDSEDEQIIVKHESKVEEDLEFDKAFKLMMQSSADSRKHIPRVNVDKMAIPTVVKTTHHVDVDTDAKADSSAAVVFRLLKRGNKGKLEAREILVPQATSLAQHSQRQEDAGKKEQSELKRLVLLGVERDEMNYFDDTNDDITGMLPPNHTTRHYVKPPRRDQNSSSSYIVANPTGRGASWGSLESFLDTKRTSIVGVGPPPPPLPQQPAPATRGGRGGPGGRGYRSGR